MRIKESQIRAIIRKEIKSLLEANEEDQEMTGAPEGGNEPEAKPEPEVEEASKATMMAQKLVEKIKQDSELTSAESITDMFVVFLDSMGFSNETKLQILKNVKTETVR